MPSLRPAGPRFSLLCLGFVLCGVVTVLPGPLLPLMAARWGLRDVQSGAFFAAEFAASTAGSIFSPRRLRRNLPTGYGLMALGVVLLMIASEMARAAAGHALALAAFGVIGLGIGLSVTATNLHVASSRREAGAAGPQAGGPGAGGPASRLSVVNLWWGIGAVACPWLIAAAERDGWLRALLLLMAVGMAGMFAALLPLLRAREAPPPARRSSLAQEVGVLGFFALFLFLYVGLESAVGGWITTYAHRFTGVTLAHASLMVSLYWMALLVGRGLGSVALRWIPERTVLLPSLAVALIAVTTLMAPHSIVGVMLAVAVAGAGFGPVFPIGVSRMLARLEDHRNTGWVFATCASGGAALPWLTGLVSTRSGSLRIGFAVPAAALAAVLVLALLENGILPAQTAKRAGLTAPAAP